MDWLEFFNSNSIEYVSRGPNTKRGELSIKCPYCGEDDPSQHLGINLTKELWGCHRNVTHRGKSPLKLVQALLGCSYSQARLIVAQYSHADPDSLPLLNLTSEAPSPSVGPLKMPPEFRAIRYDDRFWQYLLNRGYNPSELIESYQLKCAVTGRYKDRVIIPFYQDGTLVGWTGRAITNPVSAPRYLSSGSEVKKTVFNEDVLRCGDELLFITEGPFDAMKIDYYGDIIGARATCTFGTTPTVDQLAILSQLQFEKKVVLFDEGAIEQAWNIASWLPNAIIGELPAGVSDPGELSEKQVVELIKKYKIPLT